MARSKNNQRAATRVAVDVGSTGTRPVSKFEVALLALCVVAAMWAVAMMTKPGRVGYAYLFSYLEYYMGVISLVSLSITIMVGLVATDRLVLSIRQRVLLQSTHRTTGVIAVSALFVHVWTKFANQHISAIDIFIPFLHPGLNRSYVGFGTISAWIMVMVMWTGIARSRFIGRGKPWMWRGIHSISYLMWPIALLHGLGAGRPAPTWVTVSYVICVLGVLVGLAVRLSVSLNRKKDFSSAAGTGIKPAAKVVPTGALSPKRRPGRRGEPAVDLLAPADPATETWVPAAPPRPPMTRPVSPAPAAQFPAAQFPAAAQFPPAAQFPAGQFPADQYPTDQYPAAQMPVSPAPAGQPLLPADEMPPPRRRVAAEIEGPAPRQRRAAEDDDRFDTSTRAMSRRDIEEERYRYDDEPAPRTRGGRAQEIYDAGPRRGRRYEDDEPAPRDRRDVETTGTRMRRDDLESTGTRMRRDDLESTGTRMRRDDPESTGTRMRRDEIESTGTRMRRYADEEPEPRVRRRAAEYDDSPRSPRGDYEDVPAPRAARYADEPAGYAEEVPPRRAAARSSRSQFVDLSEDQWGQPDDSPTLVEAAPRRARRAAEPDDAAPAPRRGRGRDDDESYFSQLRGDTRESN